MGTRLKQVSAVTTGLLLLLVVLVYLKRWSDAQAIAQVCPGQTLSSHSPRVPNQNGFIGNGQKCCDFVNGKALEKLCEYDDKSTTPDDTLKGPTGCTCMDYFYCKLVVVSSVSSNHFSEATGMIVSVQRHMPHTRLILYSLGLTGEESELLSSYCNLELRVFDFSKYPHVAYSRKNLRAFGWKPLIVKEISEEYEVLAYFDSSVRLTGPIDKDVLKYLLSSPAFIAGPWKGNSCIRSDNPIVSYTHDETLKYLFPVKSQNLIQLRKELRVWGHIQAGCWLMWLNSEMRKKVLNNWVDCAFHEQCMAPRESKIDACISVISDYVAEGRYIGCHRYDQSALNLIFYREFGESAAERVCHNFVFYLLQIQRESNLVFYLLLGFVVILIAILAFLNWLYS